MSTTPIQPAENQSTSNEDLLAQYVERARAAIEKGEIFEAIQVQEEATSLAHQERQDNEMLSVLSVLFFNLADFYGQADHYDQAVLALEEVVFIDQIINHPDQETDRRALQSARKLAALTPEERKERHRRKTQNTSAPVSKLGEELEASLQAQLAELPSEQRPQVETALRQAISEFQALTPEEQLTLAERENHARLEDAASKMRDAALAYAHDEAPEEAVLNYISDLMDQIYAHEQPGSDWYQVGELCTALIAAIKKQSLPPVPAVYQAYLAVVLDALDKK
jgi:hypothetical protein